MTGRQPLRPSRKAQTAQYTVTTVKQTVKIKLGHVSRLPSRAASARDWTSQMAQATAVRPYIRERALPVIRTIMLLFEKAPKISDRHKGREALEELAPEATHPYADSRLALATLGHDINSHGKKKH